MGVYIKGMNKIPSCCDECPFNYDYLECLALVNAPSSYEVGRRPDCPLIEVKEPHGRLIDAELLEKELAIRWDLNDDQDFCNKEVWHGLTDAPTVIEGSE